MKVLEGTVPSVVIGFVAFVVGFTDTGWALPLIRSWGDWGGDGVLLSARVDGLFSFEDVEFVVGSRLGCGESWAECVGEPMGVDEFAA
jgi:hypothetical protein